MAGVLLQQQRLEESAKHYTRALELNENNACWLVDLGHINRVRNNRNEAKMCFIKATHVNPEFAIAFSNLACIFKDEGKHLDKMRADDSAPRACGMCGGSTSFVLYFCSLCWHGTWACVSTPLALHSPLEVMP